MRKKVIYYELNKKKLIDENGKTYTSYGIDCIENEYGFKKLFGQINDVSMNFVKAQNFINIINESELSYIHLMDAIDDFIQSNS